MARFNPEKLGDPLPPDGRIRQEIEALRKKIADLQEFEQELVRAESALQSAAPGQAGTTVDQVKSEIRKRLGYFPRFFAPAADSPVVLNGFWQQSLASYYDNPIPERFKEALFAQLARYCSVPYSIVTHSCALHRLGTPAAEVFRVLSQPTPSLQQDLLPALTKIGSATRPLTPWPDGDAELEDAIGRACILIYLKPADTGPSRAELRHLLGANIHAHLIAFIAYARMFHFWMEAHPEITYHSEPPVRSHILNLLQEEARLAPFFRNYHREFGEDRPRLAAEEALRASEARYLELFESANDMVCTLDLDGNITSLNRAAERITGYSRAEALRMKLADFAAPESQDVVRRMLERQATGENSASHELEIVTRDGQRVALEINTHIITRDGHPVGLQGIARDITERKKTEEALQQAKAKLEAWVRELEQRTREMTLLSEMGDMLRACLTTQEAYSVIVRVAQQIFPEQTGALYAISPSRSLVEAVAVWGDAVSLERVFAPDECWGLRRGRVHWVVDPGVGLICKHLRPAAPQGYLCVPMMAQSEALGILFLTQPAGTHLTEAKQRLALAMSEHIAMALSNLRLHETLRSQSIRDPLTGLFNRRFMEESLSLELRRAARNQRPLGIIMLDLDRFKHFNDTYGHDAGDTLLRELGALLQANIRGEDIACRYGGEEFTLILPEGSAEGIRQRAEALREAIRRLEVVHRGKPLGTIAASLGVAIFPEHGRTGDALLQAADAALYQSKDAGGNKVTLAK